MININNTAHNFLNLQPIPWTAVGYCINTTAADQKIIFRMNSQNRNVEPCSDGKYIAIQCSPGDKFTITARGTDKYKPYAFTNSQEIKLEVSPTNILEEQVIIAPQNAKYLIINNCFEKGYSNYKNVMCYYGDPSILQVYNLSNKIQKTQEYNLIPKFTNNQVINGNKTITSSQNYKCTDRIAVNKGDILRFNLRANQPIIIYKGSEKTLVLRSQFSQQGSVWAQGEYIFFENQPDGTTGYFQACSTTTDFDLARAYLTTTAMPTEFHHKKNYAYLITALSAGYYSTQAQTLSWSSSSSLVTTNFISTTDLPKKFFVTPHIKNWIEYNKNKQIYATEQEPLKGFHDIGSFDQARVGAVIEPNPEAAYIRIVLFRDGIDKIQIEEGESYTFYESPGLLLPSEKITLNNTQRNVVENIARRIGSGSLYKKKWTVCGDSFSFGAFQRSIYPSEEHTILEEGPYKWYPKTYCNLIANRNDMTLVNLSYNGMTMATPKNSIKPKPNSFSSTAPQFYWYHDIPEDTDFITLYFGINDFHHSVDDTGEVDDGEEIAGTVTLGNPTDGFQEIIKYLWPTSDDKQEEGITEINDPIVRMNPENTTTTVTNASFCGAYNIVLGWIRKNRPLAHVGIIVTNGASHALAQATIDIAKQWGIPYIDMNGDQRTPPMIRSTNPNIDPRIKEFITAKQAVRPYKDEINDIKENIHPNGSAHEFESNFIEEFLRSI